MSLLAALTRKKPPRLIRHRQVNLAAFDHFCLPISQLNLF
jgi:hypothetical protein